MLNALTRADEFTVVSSVYNAAIYARRPDVAGFAARHLTAPSRSASTRAFGHLLLTDLELALGRTAAARSRLGELARMDPERAEIHRAMLAAAPGAGLDWMPPIAATLASDHRQGGEEDRWRPEAALGTLPATYAGGLLAALAGDRAGVRDAIARIEADSSAPGDYAGDLRLAAATRFVATAARDVPSPRFEVGAEQAILSPFLSRPVRRYLEGRRLEAAGRPRDALVWYGSLEGFAVGDLPWGIPALLDRARIHEMLGEDVEAAALYRRYAALRAWADDPEPRRFALGRLRDRDQHLLALAARGGDDEADAHAAALAIGGLLQDRLRQQIRSTNLQSLLPGLFVVMLMGILLTYGLQWVERRVMPWRE